MCIDDSPRQRSYGEHNSNLLSIRKFVTQPSSCLTTVFSVFDRLRLCRLDTDLINDAIGGHNPIRTTHHQAPTYLHRHGDIPSRSQRCGFDSGTIGRRIASVGSCCFNCSTAAIQRPYHRQRDNRDSSFQLAAARLQRTALRLTGWSRFVAKLVG